MTSFFLIALLQANPHLPKAIEQVRALDEQAALVTLALGKNWRENTARDLAQIHLWFGLAYVGLAREADARDSFRAALLLDDTLELPAGTSPVVTQWWSELGGRTGNPALLPLLPDEASPSPERIAVAPPAVRPVRWKPWVGAALSVAAAATLGAGVYFGVQARNLRTAAESAPRAATADALNGDAVAAAQRGNWLFAAGGAGALAGAGFLVF